VRCYRRSMRHPRPAIVFTAVAAVFVLWFVARMGFGADPRVWRTSCLLGAWAPVLGASLLLYVRAVGEREHSVGVAWLVRAIGMHCVLLWMVGVGDWLGGPPGSSTRWIADVGAPLVLLGFFPVFAMTFAALEWARSVARRMPHAFDRPAMPDERGRVTVFRGVALVREQTPVAPVSRLAYALCALSVAASCAAPSPSLAGLSALLLAVPCARNGRALVPSIASLSLCALVAALSAAHRGADPWIALAIAPWGAIASVAVLLAPLELTLRARPAPAR
jgi:hypothetical protein